MALSLTLGRVLGTGGMGQVFAATTDHGLQVAVKVAWPKLAQDPRLRRLLEGEVRAMARLDHPHLLRILERSDAPLHDPRVPAGTPYVVVEACSGGTLEAHPPASLEALLEILVPLLDGLAHAHARGVLHRALKPANVLLAGPGDLRPGLKLADFGVAHALGSGEGRRGVAGSPAYMAPEQATGRTEGQGPWSDLYALGVVTEELVTGRLPDDTGEEGTARFPVPGALWDWVRALRQRDPAARPRSAAVAWALLHERLPDRVPPPPTGWRSPPRPSTPRALGAALVGALSVAFVALEAERRTLWDWVTGPPGAFAITGTEGIGKSRLLTWLGERVAETATAEVVRVDCSAAEPLGALLSGLLHLTEVPPFERRDALRRALLAHGVPADEVVTLFELRDEGGDRWGGAPVVEAVVARVVREPTLLVLDAVDRSIGAARLVRGLLDRFPAVPLHLAVAGLPFAGVPSLTLAPLEPSEVEELVRTHAEVGADAASALARAAGGHPGYALELLASWLQAGTLVPGRWGLTLTGPPPGPSGWAERLEQLVADLDPRGIVALERAAIQGVRVDEDLWDASCDEPGGPGTARSVSPIALRARLAVLAAFLDRGLCHESEGGFVFLQPGLAEALVGRARAAGRLPAHHAALVGHLPAGDGAAALRRGQHLVGARRYLEALEPLASALEHYAAREARGRDAALRALEALALPETHPARIRYALGRSAHALQTARTAEGFEWAQRALTQADALGDGPLIANALVRLSDCWFMGAPPPEATATLARIEPLVAVLPLAWQVTHLGRLAYLRAAAGDTLEAERLTTQVDALAAGAASDPRVGASWLESLSFRGRHEQLLGVAEQVWRQSRARGDLGLALFAGIKRVEALQSLGRTDEAAAELDRTGAVARQLGQLRTQLLLQLQRVDLHRASGQWRAVAEASDHGLGLEREADYPQARALFLLRRAEAAAQLAEGAALAWVVAELERVVPTAGFDDAALADLRALPAVAARWPQLAARLAALG